MGLVYKMFPQKVTTQKKRLEERFRVNDQVVTIGHGQSLTLRR